MDELEAIIALDHMQLFIKYIVILHINVLQFMHLQTINNVICISHTGMTLESLNGSLRAGGNPIGQGAGLQRGSAGPRPQNRRTVKPFAFHPQAGEEYTQAAQHYAGHHFRLGHLF